MPKIFVYHSNERRRKIIERAFMHFYQKVDKSPPIAVFGDHLSAAKWLEENARTVDILFVDCSDQQVAVQLVKIVRRENLRASWVYLDSSKDKLCASLLLRPSVYLEDSSDIKQVLHTINRLHRFHRSLEKRHDFVFKYDGDYVHIPYQNISYFESNAKKVILHLRDRSQTYYFTAKLDDIQKLLPDQFLRCHQSYIVNLDEVRRLDAKDHQFILNNNEDILISRRQYTAAKEQYENYLDSNTYTDYL